MAHNIKNLSNSEVEAIVSQPDLSQFSNAELESIVESELSIIGSGLVPGGIAPLAQPTQESQVGEAFKFGLQQQVVPAAVRTARRLGITEKDLNVLPPLVRFPAKAAFLLEKSLKPAQDFIPTTPDEKLIAGLTSFFDPSVLAVGIIVEVLLAHRALKVFGLLTSSSKIQMIAKVAIRGESLGVYYEE